MKHPIKKLIQDATFSPSLVPTVVATKKRVASDKNIHRIALIFAFLTLGINTLMYVSPPEGSLASSSNDLVTGGLGSNQGRARDVLAQALKNDRNPGGQQEEELRALYRHYGIETKDVTKAKETSLCLSCDESLYSVSREQAMVPDEDSTVVIAGHTYYEQPLAAIQTNSSNQRQTARALKIKNGIYVLYDSGNIVLTKKTKARLSLKSSVELEDSPTIIAAEGEKIASDVHRFTISNNGSREAIFGKLSIEIPQGSELIQYDAGKDATNYYQSETEVGVTKLVVEWDSISIGSTKTVEVVMKQTEKQSSPSCLVARLQSLETASIENTSCSSLPAESSAPPVAVDEEVELGVKAVNVTTGKAATDEAAHAGDKILYTITAKNLTESLVTGYEIPATSIGDVDEYAAVTATENGKIVNDAIQWSIIDLGPGETITRSFTATIDEKLPSTTQSTSDAHSYDCRISNFVGRTVISIDIACGVTKQVEQSVNSLPYISNYIIVGLLSGTMALSWLMYSEHKYLFTQLEFIHRQHT